MKTWLVGDDNACAAHHPTGTNIPPGADLPRREWVTLNHLRTGVGRFGANMYRWRLRPSAACLSGAPEARSSFGLPHWPEQPVPLNRGLVAAAPWSSIAAGLIRKKICKSLGIVMPRITNKIKSLTKIYWEKWYSLSCYLPGWKLTFRRVLYSVQCRRIHLQLESVAMVNSMGNYLFQNWMHCLKWPLTVALLGIVAFLKLVVQPHALIMKISSSHLGFVNVAMVICPNYCQK